MNLESKLREFWKTLDIEWEDLPEGILDGRLFFRRMTPADVYAVWEAKMPKELRDALPSKQVLDPLLRWQRINGEPFEYAIHQGSHGDEFVRDYDGSCLRRPLGN